MKNWLSVNILLVLLILLVSCATIQKTYTSQEQTEIVASAIQLADRQMADDDYVSALETYNKAIKEVSDYRLFYNQAYCLFNLGYFEEAAEICKNASYSFPNQKEKFINAQAYYLLEGNNLLSARFVYEQLISLYPENKDYRYCFINCLIKSNENQLALEEAIKLWNEKNFDFKTSSILYSLDPDNWGIVYESFKYDSENSTD